MRSMDYIRSIYELNKSGCNGTDDQPGRSNWPEKLDGSENLDGTFGLDRFDGSDELI